MSTLTYYSVSWSVQKTWCLMSVVILWRNLWPLFTTTSSMPIISVSFLSARQQLSFPSLNNIPHQRSSVFLYFLRPVNDGRSAVPCAHSYFLFEPEDRVMKQNLLYYKAFSEQWGLQPDHFTPRMVRGKLCPDINIKCAICLNYLKKHRREGHRNTETDAKRQVSSIINECTESH